MNKTANKPGARRFTGQEDGDALAMWLNGEYSADDRKQSSLRKSVAHLITMMNSNADMFVQHAKADPELTERIDRELSKYRFQVETVQVQDSGKYKAFSEQRRFFRWTCKQGQLVAAMMLALVRLAELGLLRRLRPCVRCSRWFFAKFNHQRFCGEQCQVLHYQTGEYWKQRRRNRYAEQLRIDRDGGGYGTRKAR